MAKGMLSTLLLASALTVLCGCAETLQSDQAASSAPTVAPTPTWTLQQHVTARVQAQVGDVAKAGSLHVDVTPSDAGGPYVQVEFMLNPDDNVTARDDIERTAYDVMHDLYTSYVHPSRVAIHVTGAFQDQYGQTVTADAALAVLDADTAQHIVWDNLDYGSFWQVLDTHVMHPGL